MNNTMNQDNHVTLASFPKSKWKSMLSCLKVAMSKDLNRPIINSIYLEGGSKGLSLVSTDGRRMHVITVDGSYQEFQVIISRDDVSMILKHALKGKGDEPIEFCANQEGKTACFMSGDAKLVSFNPVRGNYPNFRQVLPKGDVYQELSLETTKAALLQWEDEVKRAEQAAFAFWSEHVQFDGSNSSLLAMAEKVRKDIKKDIKWELERNKRPVPYLKMLGVPCEIRPLSLSVSILNGQLRFSQVIHPDKREHSFRVDRDFLVDLVDAYKEFSSAFGSDSVQFCQKGVRPSEKDGCFWENPISLSVSNVAFGFQAIVMPQNFDR